MTHFPGAVRILDYYHADEHLAEFCHLLPASAARRSPAGISARRGSRRTRAARRFAADLPPERYAEPGRSVARGCGPARTRLLIKGRGPRQETAHAIELTSRDPGCRRAHSLRVPQPAACGSVAVPDVGSGVRTGVVRPSRQSAWDRLP